jgi:hypothetical protein
VTAIVSTEHRFAVVPATLDRETWLATRGQGYGSQVRPPDAMHEANILDLEAIPADTKKPN